MNQIEVPDGLEEKVRWALREFEQESQEKNWHLYSDFEEQLWAKLCKYFARREIFVDTEIPPAQGEPSRLLGKKALVLKQEFDYPNKKDYCYNFTVFVSYVIDSQLGSDGVIEFNVVPRDCTEEE